MSGLLQARIEANSIPEPNTGCWIWLLKINRSGYAHTSVDGRHTEGHRAAYRAFKGEIPAGLQVDHRCRQRCCVNPDHLEAVTSRENTLRGNSFAAERARQTHCIHGHPLSGPNLFVTRRGQRQCRVCRNAARSRYRRNRRTCGTEAKAA